MKIAIIDDEMNICLTLQSILQDDGYEVAFSQDGAAGLELIRNFHPAVLLLDVRLDGMNGLDLLEKAMKAAPQLAVIMISGHSGIREAVRAIKLGAFDFLEKPLSLPKVKITVSKAIQFKAISAEYHRLKNDVDERYRIVGQSASLETLKNLIARIAPTDSKVLIRGESGTGKELIAYAIHNGSKRFDKPFIKFNSAAIPSELVESELFGFEKGAFTGAVKSKSGKIEQADGGTLFLDEIGDMNPNAQAKILRVIQEGEFERVGSNKTQKINTRIIAATHKNLEEMVVAGSFREDLFYRLNVIPVAAPPLRQHPEDIPVLVEYFCDFFASDLNIPRKSFTPASMVELQSWEFPGNVRQLRNLVERLYIIIEEDQIEPRHLCTLITEAPRTAFWNETKLFKEKKREFEIRYLSTQLRINNGNLSRTAEALGLQVSNLSRKLKELELS
ncbi:MAG: sigma-54-dependent Fis family transcriptional regulator [Candidatus Cloacimonetes bacterium]|nr:sigma-54-dependent Fis family transcriptional regulator [Candidatus Cloacimonadota bacterium]